MAVDGSDVGVTPKGAANTFNVELEFGPHSVTITCLDDGGNPLGNDIGTACVTVLVFGGKVIGGRELGISYGGSADVGFSVENAAAPGALQRVYDGRTLQGLE